VYAVAPHTGRGGWTWYTGSSGWMYRLILESLLGLHLEVDTLTVKPCIPAHWTTFSISYRYRSATYQIVVTQSDGQQASVKVDGVLQADGVIHLVDDALMHRVEIQHRGAID